MISVSNSDVPCPLFAEIFKILFMGIFVKLDNSFSASFIWAFSRSTLLITGIILRFTFFAK